MWPKPKARHHNRRGRFTKPPPPPPPINEQLAAFLRHATVRTKGPRKIVITVDHIHGAEDFVHLVNRLFLD